MKILSDIGGTYARFAQYDGQKITAIDKYAAADYPSFEVALEAYCDISHIDGKPVLVIATAAYPDDDGIWRFVNRNKWKINPAALAKDGWVVEHILNDFEAAAWALKDLDGAHLTTVKAAAPPKSSYPLCLLGPGTGLGLAYYHSQPSPHVQKTHGGHMLAACTTEEQWSILQKVQELNNNGAPVNFENLASGPGLLALYNAVRALNDLEPDAKRTEDVLDNITSKEAKYALRLFHEFLGLFAHTAVITAHAYGGVYMVGGMIERLSENGLFDAQTFNQYFKPGNVDSVETALENTPVYIIDEPYLSLRGLETILQETS